MSVRIRGRQASVGRTAAAIVAVAIALLGSVGCKNTNFLSTKQEVSIGRDASSEMERRYRVDSSSPDATRVQRIAERLLPHASDRPGVPYSVKVIVTKDVNAVSLPGGPVYVYRGLLDLVGSDDDALAGVIGHELGHINARHAAKLISQQMAANVGIIVLARGSTAQTAAGWLQDLLSLSYSRDDEYEADKRGLSYAFKAGYDPRGMVRFFGKLASLEKGTDGKRRDDTPAFLRTHPVTSSRIARAQKAIDAHDFPYGR